MPSEAPGNVQNQPQRVAGKLQLITLSKTFTTCILLKNTREPGYGALEHNVCLIWFQFFFGLIPLLYSPISPAVNGNVYFKHYTLEICSVFFSFTLLLKVFPPVWTVYWTSKGKECCGDLKNTKSHKHQATWLGSYRTDYGYTADVWGNCLKMGKFEIWIFMRRKFIKLLII